MITAEVFTNLFYKQKDHYCVLASYAVAAYPFTNQEVIPYFIDYCRHFNLSANSNNAESKYLKDFELRSSATHMNGYLVKISSLKHVGKLGNAFII